jgi:glycosyltransferase involved in cell wall biosynthesis
VRCLFTIEAAFAGVGRHVRSLARGLASHGIDVIVAYAPQRADEMFLQFVREPPDGVLCTAVDMERSLCPIRDARALWALWKTVCQAGPIDLVHGHSAKGGALARIVGRVAGLPTVYSPHASPFRISNTYYALEWLLARAMTDLVIAVSESERSELIQNGVVAAHSGAKASAAACGRVETSDWHRRTTHISKGTAPIRPNCCSYPEPEDRLRILVDR